MSRPLVWGGIFDWFVDRIFIKFGGGILGVKGGIWDCEVFVS